MTPIEQYLETAAKITEKNKVLADMILLARHNLDFLERWKTDAAIASQPLQHAKTLDNGRHYGFAEETWPTFDKLNSAAREFAHLRQDLLSHYRDLPPRQQLGVKPPEEYTFLDSKPTG